MSKTLVSHRWHGGHLISEKRRISALLAKGAAVNPCAWALMVLGMLMVHEPLSALGAARPVLSAHVPAAAKAAAPVGRLPGDRRLNLAIGLPLRHPDALTNLLGQLYDPAHPRYHQYLTPEQFTAQFGPAEQDYQSLMAFARAHGLKVTAVHPNRVVLDVSGSVADLERAFHLTLRTYQHPVESRAFYAPDAEPTLELAVPVLHITGLSDFQLPHPASLAVRPVGPGTGGWPAGGSGPSGLYRGNDFRAAYAPGVSLNGAGQMVGLVEFDGYYPNDITTYCSQAGLTPVPLINVFLDDFTGSPGSGNGEVALDIEMANSMAPGLAAIIVYQAGPNGYFADMLNRMATDNLAKQLSCSWGLIGSDPTLDQIFQQFAAQGQSFFNASSDKGAITGAVQTPLDNPYVTCVGGTTLTTGSTGTWMSETAWNWYSTGEGNAATGGGISSIYAIPPWQRGIPSLSTNGGSTTMRNIPDVAMVADNTCLVADNGAVLDTGGTSVASPLWAGFTALVNQQAASLGQPPVGFLNPALYALGAGPGYPTNFHDITTGNNTNYASPHQFYAGPSYDLCTGWGSPAGQSLINTLAPRPNAIWLTNAGTSLVAEGCPPPNGVVDPGETVSVLFGLANLGAVDTTNLVATLQADSGVLAPSSPQTYGKLAGGGSAVARAFTFTANGLCGGTLLATLQLQDGALNLGTLTFSFTLGKPVTPLVQNFDGVTASALPSGWTTTASGGGVGWVTSTALQDTTPNAAFAAEPTNASLTELLSPLIPIATASAQLTFRNNYNTETDPVKVNTAYDGGVLEIRLGGTGQFTDILAAGGSFVSGGYNRTIDATDTDNVLAGRLVWAGLSGGFITTTANLPAAAAGQSVQFKWRFGTDVQNYYGGQGWCIDTVSVRDGAQCCDSGTDLAVSLTPAQGLAGLGQPFLYSILITNSGLQSASSVTVTSLLSPTVLFSSASGGGSFTNSAVTWNLGALPAGGAAHLVLAVIPATLDRMTNTVTVAATTPDPALGNNTATVAATVVVPPTIPLGSLSLGQNVSFSLNSVTGVSYTLQYKNALSDPVWLAVPPPAPGTGGPLILLDTNPPAGPSRFYRAICQ